MEKDIALGSVGSVDLVFSGGKASLSLQAAVPEAGAVANVSVVVDAAGLVDKLFAAIEKASPAGAVPIEEGVKAVVKAAVAAV